MTDTLGGRIKYLLDSKGLTQRELAKECGLTEATIGRYVANSRTPNATNLCSIASALKVTPNRLVGWKETKGKAIIVGRTTHYYICGECGCDIDPQDNYCRKCGVLIDKVQI